MAFLLVSQSPGQAVTLQSEGTELALSGAEGGLGHTQLLPQVGVGSCQYGKKKLRKKSARKIRPDCSAVGPNLGDYTQWVR